MDDSNTIKQQTRRRLRTRGTTRKTQKGAVRINVDAATAILQPIYAALPTTKAAGQHNLTYGEIEWGALKYINEQAEKQVWSNVSGSGQGSKGKFYDLGCGRGRAVLYMALAGPFDQSIGIEVLPERVSLAQEALQKLKLSIPNANAKVRFYEASFLNPAFKYKDARVIFLSNLCFDDETQSAIFKKLNLEMAKGSLVFCSQLPSSIPTAFEYVGKELLPMTWTTSSHLHMLRHL